MSPHWGENYYLRSSEQTNLAQRLVNAGVDVILGHGPHMPHMMNDICMVDGVWVVYNLGNLIFNSEGEYDSRGVQPYSLIAEMAFSRRGNAVSGHMNLYPIVSCNQLTQFQPTFVDDLQFEQVVGMLKGMHYDSTEFLANIELREVDGRRCMTMKVF